MRRNRNVKILATIGPASSSEEMLRKLFDAGADVFRINMSHTDHELMRTLVARIRSVEEAVGRPIGILAPVAEDARRYLEWGATLVAVGSDIGVLVRGTDQLVREFVRDPVMV